ncbi:unnamed protein product [Angiostrongylus costaricensis]|uniref:GTP-binding protein Rheb n=1 Tax=Angiostrongylus costaricensis TaxID=334426 RepID=A0A0R3PAV8_ANGCS|nr:unnamed protein product [Angiostrongylus costaricensis]
MMEFFFSAILRFLSVEELLLLFLTKRFKQDSSSDVEPIEGQLRSFEYKHGSFVDNGYEFKGLGRAISRKRDENRRATCPEIYLQPETSSPTRHVVVRIYGSRNSGKKTLAHQIHHVASTTTPNQTHFISGETEEAEPRTRTTNFLLNGEEVQLETVMESTLESAPFTDQLTTYIVIYSVDSRESFKRATNILYRIYQTRKCTIIPVLLVGNKIDLKRNIVVSTIEGKSLSKIYKCGFVEVSALLSMNITTMWAELIRQIQDPFDHKPSPEHSWVHRLVVRGRHIAKSCEELVQKIIA